MPIDQERRKRMLGHIDRWKSSGKSQREYCKQERIDYHQFHYWYRVSRGKADKKKSARPGFVPIRITEDIHFEQPQSILITGSNGLVASFPAHDASISLIRQLLIG